MTQLGKVFVLILNKLCHHSYNSQVSFSLNSPGDISIYYRRINKHLSVCFTVKKEFLPEQRVTHLQKQYSCWFFQSCNLDVLLKINISLYYNEVFLSIGLTGRAYTEVGLFDFNDMLRRSAFISVSFWKDYNNKRRAHCHSCCHSKPDYPREG